MRVGRWLVRLCGARHRTSMRNQSRDGKGRRADQDGRLSPGLVSFGLTSQLSGN